MEMELEKAESGDLQSETTEKRSQRAALLYDLGFSRDYKAVWEFQKQLLEQRISGEIPDALILVEHDHVLTLGRTGHSENILTAGLPTFEIERGGDVTYHGPGQLVAYPIISLTSFGMGIRQYVEALEAVVIDALKEVGISNCLGKLGPLTGVWVDDKRKIASIGVATSHWVTYHGFALNVSTDLSYFGKIKPCGFESSIMTSVEKELGDETAVMDEIKSSINHSFSKRFGLKLQPMIAKF